MTQEKSAFDRFRNWVGSSVTLKLFGIGIIILFLLIPVSMVEDLIRERNYYHQEVEDDITSSWGHSQTLSGPVLTVPYETKRIIEDLHTKTREEIHEVHYAHFLPEVLDISGKLSDKTLHRGIYNVTAYESDLALRGYFEKPDIDQWHVENPTILWEKAVISMGIPDLRGVQENILLHWNDSTIAFDSGTEIKGIINTGVSAKVKAESETEQFDFSCNIKLKGSDGLQFIPLGKTTTVHIESPWPDPSFYGEFLPDSREISSEGFTADWKVLHLNRSIPQKFVELPQNVDQYSFGVTLYESVDSYHKTERCAKYAILFIALTFVTFFFIQIINKVSVHAVQFIIVGLALILFYVLLLSLSEHLGFDWAYLVAAIGIIIQISWYVKSIFKSKKLGGIMMLILVMLYGFIYNIIQLANYSLLVGSIGLFVVLGVLMYLSRNIDWYALRKKDD